MDLHTTLDSLEIRHARAGEHHHARSGWTQIDCPSCSPASEKYRLGINERKLYANCWRCGAISLVEIFKLLLNCSYAKAKQIADNIDGRAFKQVSEAELYKTRKLVLPKRLGPLQKAHKRYLTERGFNPDDLQRLWDIKGIGIDSRLSWRVFIPVLHKGAVVSWTTRSISKDVKLRYINASDEEEKIPQKHLLYGEDYCRGVCVICEGPTDAWNIGPSAVATLGLSYTQQQIQKMTQHPVRAICFDSSAAAQVRAEKLCDQLQAFPGDTYVIELDAEDPGSATKREIKLLRKSLGI